MNEMEMEDYYHQCRAECAALKEQMDNLVAMLRKAERSNEDKDREITKLREQVSRMTLALDDALGLQRARLAEKEALEL